MSDAYDDDAELFEDDRADKIGSRTPGRSLIKCCEQDLSRKGTKKSKSQIMIVLPAYLSIQKSFEGRLGHLVNLNSKEPTLVVETSEGSLCFKGRLLRSSNALFTVDCMPNGSSSTISDLYQDILVFEEPTFEPIEAGGASAAVTSAFASSVAVISGDGVEKYNSSKDSISITPLVAEKSTRSSSGDNGGDGEGKGSPPSSEKAKRMLFDFGVSAICDPVGSVTSSASKLNFHSLSQSSNSQKDPSSQHLGEEENRESDNESVGDEEEDDEVEYLNASDDSVSVEGERRSSRSMKKRNYAEYTKDEEEVAEQDEVSSGYEEGSVELASLELLPINGDAKGKPRKTNPRSSASGVKVQSETIEILDDSSSGCDAHEDVEVEMAAASSDECDSDSDTSFTLSKKKVKKKSMAKKQPSSKRVPQQKEGERSKKSIITKPTPKKSQVNSALTRKKQKITDGKVTTTKKTKGKKATLSSDSSESEDDASDEDFDFEGSEKVPPISMSQRSQRKAASSASAKYKDLSDGEAEWDENSRDNQNGSDSSVEFMDLT